MTGCRAIGQAEGSVVGGPASAQNATWNPTISVGDYNSWIIDGNYGNPGGTGAVQLSLPFINNALGAGRDNPNPLKSSVDPRREKYPLRLSARRDSTMKQKFECCSRIRPQIFRAALAMPTIFAWPTPTSREQPTSTAYPHRSLRVCQPWPAAAPITPISPPQPPRIQTPALDQHSTPAGWTVDSASRLAICAAAADSGRYHIH